MLKENSAKAASKRFHANVTVFHTYLTSSKDGDQIDRKVDELIAWLEKTEVQLNTWLDLMENIPQAELISE